MSPSHATYCAHLIPLGFIIIILCNEWYIQGAAQKVGSVVIKMTQILPVTFLTCWLMLFTISCTWFIFHKFYFKNGFHCFVQYVVLWSAICLLFHHLHLYCFSFSSYVLILFGSSPRLMCIYTLYLMYYKRKKAQADKSGDLGGC